MLKKIFTNRYVIAGIIVFAILFAIGLYLEFPVGQALFASALMASLGIAVAWWQDWGL